MLTYLVAYPVITLKAVNNYRQILIPVHPYGRYSGTINPGNGYDVMITETMNFSMIKTFTAKFHNKIDNSVLFITNVPLPYYRRRLEYVRTLTICVAVAINIG